MYGFYLFLGCYTVVYHCFLTILVSFSLYLLLVNGSKSSACVSKNVSQIDLDCGCCSFNSQSNTCNDCKFSRFSEHTQARTHICEKHWHHVKVQCTCRRQVDDSCYSSKQSTSMLSRGCMSCKLPSVVVAYLVFSCSVHTQGLTWWRYM